MAAISDPWVAAFFLLFVGAFAYFIWRAHLDDSSPLRPIAAYESLKNLLARAAEAGQPIHISIGTGGVGQASTADTTAGLYALEYLADRAAVNAIPPIVTVSDPTALPIAQDRLRRAYQSQGYPEEYDPRQVRFVAPSVNGNTVAYSAGVMELMAHERLMANVMIGAFDDYQSGGGFGDEFLLIGEPGARRNMLQVIGTSNPAALPFVYATSSHPLIGEEIYAAGAYLNARRGHVGSLLAQDAVRGLLVVIAIAAVLARLAGLG